MCESFYVHYGFISSGAVYVYINYCRCFSIGNTVRHAEKPNHLRIEWASRHRTLFVIFSNSLLLIGIFPKTNYQQYLGKITKPQAHRWIFGGAVLIIMTSDNSKHFVSASLCNRDEMKLLAASWWGESLKLTDRSQKTDSHWLNKNTTILSLSALYHCWYN